MPTIDNIPELRVYLASHIRTLQGLLAKYTDDVYSRCTINGQIADSESILRLIDDRYAMFQGCEYNENMRLYDILNEAHNGNP